MSKNNDHHYIPKGLLKEFAISGKRNLFFYDKEKPEKGVEQRNIGSIFYKKHLNTFHMHDGTKNKSLEKFYDKEFENYLPDIVGKLKSQFTALPDALTDEEEKILIQFFFNHMFRSPDVHGPMLERHTSEAEYSMQQIDNIRVAALRDQPKDLLDFLSKIPVVLAKPSNPKDIFIVGSNPVMHLLPQGEASGSLGDGKMQLWAAFGSQLAVGFVPGWIGRSTVHLDSHQILGWNEKMAAQSTSFAGCAEPQVIALAKRFGQAD